MTNTPPNDANDGAQTTDHDEQHATTKIEWRDNVEDHLGAKQRVIYNAIENYGRVADDGTLDLTEVMNHVNTQKRHVYHTFGKYGRLAHYTKDVDSGEYDIEVVGGITATKEDDRNLQSSLLPLIEEHATLGYDGTVDTGLVELHTGPDGATFDPKTITTNVGRSIRVNLPYEDRPEDDRGTTITDEFITTIQSHIPVADTPDEAFNQGWRAQTVVMNVGQYIDTDVAWNERVSADARPADDEFLTAIRQQVVVPSNPNGAFVEGWRTKEKWDQIGVENE